MVEIQLTDHQLTNKEKILYIFGAIVFIGGFLGTLIFAQSFTPLTVLQIRLSLVCVALIYFLAIYFYQQRLLKKENTQTNSEVTTNVKLIGEITEVKPEKDIDTLLEDKIEKELYNKVFSAKLTDENIIEITEVTNTDTEIKEVEEVKIIDVDDGHFKSQSNEVVIAHSVGDDYDKMPNVKSSKKERKITKNKNNDITIWFNGEVLGKKKIR